MATTEKQYPELTKVLTRIGKEVKNTYKSDLKDRNKIATGKLYDSINYRLEITDNKVKLYFVAERYYINIENGRIAGAKMPPVAVIKRWMKIKGITPRKGQSINGTAYVIARSIGRKGIRKNPFLREIKESLPEHIDDIKRAIEKDLDASVKMIVEKFRQIKSNKYIKVNNK